MDKKFTIVESEDGFMFDIDAHIEMNNTTFVMRYNKNSVNVAEDYKEKVCLTAHSDGNGYEITLPEMEKKQYFDYSNLAMLYRLLDVIAKTTQLCGGHTILKPLEDSDVKR